MTFREFVELTRDAVESVAFGLSGDRDITPMLHLESELGLSVTGIDPSIFETSTGVELLVLHYVLPLIAENQARKVAWTFCAYSAPDDGRARPSEHPDRRKILLASFIDAEVIEHWAAPIVRTGGPVLIGNWSSSERNLGGGPLLTTIQEKLR